MHTGPRDSNQIEVAPAAVAGLSLSVILSILLGTVLSFFPLGVDTSVVSSIAAPEAASSVSVRPVVHAAYNSVLPITSDPWVATIASVTTAPVAVVYWAVFAIGVAVLSGSWIGVLASAALPFLFGLDLVLLGAIAWTPWILLGFRRFIARNEPALLLMLLFLGMRLPYGSGWLLAITLLFTTGMAAIIQPQSLWPKASLDRRRFCFAALTLLIGIAITIRVIPALPSFDYPLTGPTIASVVQDDGFPGLLQPLVGPSYPLQVIDHGGVSHFLAMPFLFAVLLAAAIRSHFFVTAGILTCVAVELFAGPGVRTIAPISALSRIVPGGSLYPLATLALAWVVTHQLLTTQRLRAAIFVGLAAVYGLWAMPLERNNELMTVAASLPEGVLRSPSLAVARAQLRSHTTYDGVLGAKSWKRCAAQVSIEKGSSGLQDGSPGREETSLILNDGDPQTRISLGQRSGSTMRLCFDSPLPSKIFLDVGNYRTDFPRSFSVKNEQRPDLSLDFNPWLGPYQKTASGLLYFGDQSAVQIAMPPLSNSEVSSPACVSITLTRDNNPFDWSVAELRCESELPKP